MLGIERGKGGNLVVWLILGVLALAFGLTFGLPSDQLSFGDSGLVKVHGESVSMEDFVYQKRAVSWFVNIPEGEQAQTLGIRDEILEAVIERLVLDEVGDEMGLAADKHDAELLTKDGFFVVLDQDRPWPWVTQDRFDYDWFKRSLLQLNVTEAHFLEIQRQELLARQVRDLLRASVTIPESELWAAYEAQNNELALDYVKFGASEYAELVDPTDAELDAWIADNEAVLQELWERKQADFLKLPAEVDLRLIELSKPIAPPPDSAAELVSDYEARLAAARATAEAARARIAEGGESFAAVARELSIHDSARSGGRYGWTRVTGPGSGLELAVDEAAAALDERAVSDVIVGDEALYLIMVAGRREGDVPEDLAKRELAGEAVRTARGRELAKRAAEEALLAVKEGATLSSLFGPGAGDKPLENPLGEGLGLGQDGDDDGEGDGDGEGDDDGEGDGDGESPPENIEDIGVGDAAPPPPSAAMPKHELVSTGLFTYGGEVPDLGMQPQLSATAWDSDPTAPIIDEVFEIADGFVIAKVDQREAATREGFAEARVEVYRGLTARRAAAIISAFTKHRCFLGKARVEIRVNEQQVKRVIGEIPTAEDGTPLRKPYNVCDRVGDEGILNMEMRMRGLSNAGGR